MEQQVPALVLPSAEEELKAMVEEALRYLQKANAILAMPLIPKDRELAQNRRDEACWTLATLWKAPPAASSAIVETWINASGLRAQVEPFFNRL